MSEPRVLIVDDEPSIIRMLTPPLTIGGYQVSCASTGAEALSLIARSEPDLVILDLGLPDMDGKLAIAKLREWSEAPILVLTARHEESERIAALDAGADDYVTKPFLIGELQARLRAALRGRARRSRQRHFSSAGLYIDFLGRRVTVNGLEVRLSRKEFDLLQALALHAGQVVTHKQLLAAGWGGSSTDAQFVRVYIGHLRQKIEDDPTAPLRILTEPGIGYRLAEDGLR